MIDRLVVWGGASGDKHSHRWIQKAFATTARKLGIPTVHVDDDPASVTHLTPGTTVIAADVWSRHLPTPAPDGVAWVLHNFDGNSDFCQNIDPRSLLRLQVWTTDATGEEWEPYRQFDRRAQTLFQPWGCDLLAEEFLEPVYNPQSTDAVFVGAVWSDVRNGVELGNEQVMHDARLVLADHGLRLQHLTQVSSGEMVAALRGARLAPAFAGAWQVEHGYIPCRVLKAPAYGVLALTNVPACEELFGGWHPTVGSVSDLVEAGLRLKRAEYLGVVREQQRIVSRFTYRESLRAIARALHEVRAGCVAA